MIRLPATEKLSNDEDKMEPCRIVNIIMHCGKIERNLITVYENSAVSSKPGVIPMRRCRLEIITS